MPYTETSLTDIVGKLTNRAGENSTFWIPREKQDAMNEAMCVWQLMTGEWTTTKPQGVVSGDVYYNVPKQIISTQRVLYNTTPLTPTSVEALDLGFPGWASTPGTPRMWAPIGINMIAVYPQPTSGVLNFEGMAETPTFQNNGDKLDMGEEELDPLLSYAHHYLTFKEGGAEFSASQAGLQSLVKAAGERNAELIAVASLRRLMGVDQDEAIRKPRSPIKVLGTR